MDINKVLTVNEFMNAQIIFGMIKLFYFILFTNQKATQVLNISNLFPLHSMQQLLNAFVFFLGAVSNQYRFFSFNDKKINIT